MYRRVNFLEGRKPFTTDVVAGSSHVAVIEITRGASSRLYIYYALDAL